jgi:hypothetical protein
MRQEPHQHPQGWEDALTEELRRLPDVEAPETLIPRVMALIRAKARLPWWRQTWWHWPPAAQLFVLLSFLGLVIGLSCYGPQAWDALAASPLGQAVAGWLQALAPLADGLSALVNAFALIIRQTGTLALILTAVVCLAMYLSCLGLGTMMYRVAFSKR